MKYAWSIPMRIRSNSTIDRVLLGRNRALSLKSTNHRYFGAVQFEDEVRVAVGDQRRLVEPQGRVDHGEDAQPSGDAVQVPEG